MVGLGPSRLAWSADRCVCRRPTPGSPGRGLTTSERSYRIGQISSVRLSLVRMNAFSFSRHLARRDHMATRRKQRRSAKIAKAMASVPLAWVSAELRTVHIQAAESGRDEAPSFEAMAIACAGRAGARRRARISSGGRPLQESQTRGSGARRLSHCQRAALRVRFCNARRPGLSTLGLARLCRHRHRASVEGTPTARAFPTPRPRASGRRSARGEAARRARGPALSCERS